MLLANGFRRVAGPAKSGCRLRSGLALAIVEARIVPGPVVGHFEVFQRLVRWSCRTVSQLFRSVIEMGACQLTLIYHARCRLCGLGGFVLASFCTGLSVIGDQVLCS